MKIIVNRCYGGFQVSAEAYKRYAQKIRINIFFYKEKNVKPSIQGYIYIKVDSSLIENNTFFYVQTVDLGDEVNELPNETSLYLDGDYRTDSKLIETVEELKGRASTQASKLEVIEIPDDVDWEIDDYDGMETVHEKHRSW